MTPEVPPDFGRDLKHDKLVRPGREAALAAELAEFADDGQQRVGGGLIGEIIELGSGDLERPPRRAAHPGRYAAATRAAGPAPPPAAPRCAEGPHPLLRVGIKPGRGDGPSGGRIGWHHGPDLRKPQAKLRDAEARPGHAAGPARSRPWPPGSGGQGRPWRPGLGVDDPGRSAAGGQRRRRAGHLGEGAAVHGEDRQDVAPLPSTDSVLPSGDSRASMSAPPPLIGVLPIRASEPPG